MAVMDREIVLFGSGEIGEKAIAFLGEENIVCFCDNNCGLTGQKCCGREIISFAELKQKHNEAIIIISANYKNAYEIVKQCEENEVWDYLFYESLKEAFSTREDALAFVADPVNRMRMRKSIYFNKIKELQMQVDYFKSHADIRHMKPAAGELRNRQKELVDVSEELFDKISELHIKPFLDGGNLLGYVRHNGFIPWDDDIDFALIRDEYERLKVFCREHIYSRREFANKNSIIKNIADGMQDYYWINFGDFIRIVRHFPESKDVGVEFFSLDFYNDNYLFDELMELSKTVREKMLKMSSFEEKAGYLEAVLKENEKNTAKESGHIYFGIDNMEIRNKHSRNQWIPKNVIFPLQRILFEGKNFWVPNNPEEFLQYEYDHIWEYPDDVGIPKHYIYLGISG